MITSHEVYTILSVLTLCCMAAAVFVLVFLGLQSYYGFQYRHVANNSLGQSQQIAKLKAKSCFARAKRLFLLHLCWMVVAGILLLARYALLP